MKLPWIALSFVALLSGCGAGGSIKCALTNVPIGLGSSDAATRGAATECAMHAEPAKIAGWVPVLTKNLGDTTVFREYESGGGLIGFGEAGLKQVNVSMPTRKAIERAAVKRENIAPLVEALVIAANQARPQHRGAALYGEPEDVVDFVIDLLCTRYQDATLRNTLTAAVQAAVPRIRNPAFWANEDFARQISNLYDGRIPYPWDGSASPQKWQSRVPDGVFPVGGAANAPRREASHGSGRGMTWGQLTMDGLPKGWVYLDCSGAPLADMKAPREAGQCNPYSGDTACAESRPLLCRHGGLNEREFKRAQADTAQAVRDKVLSLEYATTGPVTGTALYSFDAANAVCETQFGKGWRMAEHHDLERGWGAIGRDAGVVKDRRFWVAINDQSGNCWD